MSQENIQQNNSYEELFDRVGDANILPVPGKQETKQEELQELLDVVFKEYGKSVMEANGEKILTTLSGGLDSTIALAFLRKNFPNVLIETFTMGGDEQHPDVQHARMAAEKFGSIYHEFLPTPDDIQGALDEFGREFSDIDVVKRHGQLDVFMLYQFIKKFDSRMVIVHDGIDELMGGYWTHRKETAPDKKAKIFLDLWQKVVPDHLKPLTRTANYFNVNLLFPYLDSRVISAISQMPLDKRTSRSLSKIPLKNIAQNIGVPQEIIDRPKRGQVGMLDIRGEKSG